MIDEYFEADYVNSLGESEANQTILLRRVDFADIYCRTAVEVAEDMLLHTENATEEDISSVAIVFSRLGALLSHNLFEGEENGQENEG